MSTPPPTTPGPAGKRKSDPLAAAKIDATGTPLENPREVVVTKVAAARKAYPDGVPEGSPFSDATPRDRIESMANEYRLGGMLAFLSDEELRLVMYAEHESGLAAARASAEHQGSAPRGASTLPAVVPEPDRKRSSFAMPTSTTGVYKVIKDKRCSLAGQMFLLKRGAVIREADYMPGQVKILVDGGLELEPVE